MPKILLRHNAYRALRHLVFGREYFGIGREIISRRHHRYQFRAQVDAVARRTRHSSGDLIDARFGLRHARKGGTKVDHAHPYRARI